MTLTGPNIPVERCTKMNGRKTPKEIQDEHKPLWEAFKKLPEDDRQLIAEQAIKTVSSLVDAFCGHIKDAKGFSPEAKILAIKRVWGVVPGMTEDEANNDNSPFSRKFNIAVKAAVCEIMKEKVNAKNN